MAKLPPLRSQNCVQMDDYYISEIHLTGNPYWMVLSRKDNGLLVATIHDYDFANYLIKQMGLAPEGQSE